MSYLKIVDEKIVEAPKNTIRGDLQIFGYNRNAELMQLDGYTYYPKAAVCYLIKDNAIVLILIELPIEIKHNYSKLEIRRACRALNLLDKLNKLINADEQFAADWADANLIDLDDEMFIKAIEFGLFEQLLIDAVKHYIGG